MSKCLAKIGFSTTSETSQGVWTESIVERNYPAEIIKNVRRWQKTDYLNDDLDISNEISILADSYTYDNFHSMRYIEFMGSKWKILSVEVQYPRLIISIGGLYNG